MDVLLPDHIACTSHGKSESSSRAINALPSQDCTRNYKMLRECQELRDEKKEEMLFFLTFLVSLLFELMILPFADLLRLALLSL
jgi:hypothetical protein